MGNTESFHDLPTAQCKFQGTQEVPVEDVLQKYLRRTFPKRAAEMGEELDRLAHELEPNAEYLEFDSPSEITTKDENADALTIILEGDADLLIPHADGEYLLSVLGQHDVVGDVSLFFGIPCLHTVVAHPETCVLKIDAKFIKEIKLADMVQEDYKLEDWLVLRKQLAVPYLENLDSKAIIRKMVIRMFRQVQLFTNWQTKQLEMLVSDMPEPLVEVYPTDATIAAIGDRPRAMLLLVRGDIVFKDKFGKELLPLTVKRYPFCLGEEGLFFDDWRFPYSITANSTCQVVRVCLEDIESTSSAYLEQFPDKDVFQPWASSVERWDNMRQARDDNVHEKFRAQLQVEFVYRMLRQSQTLPLHLYSTRCIYTIAMTGVSMEQELGKTLQPASDHIALVLLVAGKLAPPDAIKEQNEDIPETYGPGSVIDCRNTPIEATELTVQEEPCVYVRFIEDEVRRIQASFFRKDSYL